MPQFRPALAPLSLCLVLSLCLTGCKRWESAPTPAEPAGSATKAAEPAAPPAVATEPPPRPLGPVKALELPPVAPGPWSEVAQNLFRAHYDAEELGLRELTFEVTFSAEKGAVEAEARGSWKSGGPPELTLTSVEKGGKALRKPREDDPMDVGQKVAWGELQFKVLKLVEGLGNGFLSRRLYDWSRLPADKQGEVAAAGEGQLKLSLERKGMGQVEALVGKSWTIQRITARAPEGFSRTMTYQYRLEKGRNLVTRAVLAARANPGAKLHQRATQVLKATDGTVFELSYGPVGRYLLPKKLVKTIPGLGEKLSLTLSYGAAKPQ